MLKEQRSALIRIASVLPEGSEERRTILSLVKEGAFYSKPGEVDWNDRRRNTVFGIPNKPVYFDTPLPPSQPYQERVVPVTDFQKQKLLEYGVPEEGIPESRGLAGAMLRVEGKKNEELVKKFLQGHLSNLSGLPRITKYQIGKLKDWGFSSAEMPKTMLEATVMLRILKLLFEKGIPYKTLPKDLPEAIGMLRGLGVKISQI